MGNFHYFTIWTSAKPRPIENDILQTRGLILSISVYMRNVLKLFHKVQGIGPVSFLQNLDLGKASTDGKLHLAILGIDFLNINVYAKRYQNIPDGSIVMGNFRKLIRVGHTTSQTDTQTDHGQITKPED